MEYQLVQSFGALDLLENEWNALLDESISRVPFLRFEYLCNWWQTMGGGEWQDATLAVVLGREAGRLVGIAPLFLARNRDNHPALLLLGSIEISDYLDVIVRESDLQSFLDGLLPFLAQAKLPAWTLLDWYNLLDNSPTLACLQKSAEKAGWEYQVEPYLHSPYILLPGDWETYLSGIDKKQRHEIRRKMRRAEQGEQPVGWYIAEDNASLDNEISAFLALMEQDPEKAAFLTPAMRDQMRRTVHCAFEKGCLQLSFMTVGEQKAAGYLSFDYLNRIWVYNSGINRNFNEYSPGWVLLAYLLRWANENGRSEFDFMRGNEDYKYRFGAVDRMVMRARVQRK